MIKIRPFLHRCSSYFLFLRSTAPINHHHCLNHNWLGIHLGLIYMNPTLFEWSSSTNNLTLSHNRSASKYFSWIMQLNMNSPEIAISQFDSFAFSHEDMLYKCRFPVAFLCKSLFQFLNSTTTDHSFRFTTKWSKQDSCWFKLVVGNRSHLYIFKQCWWWFRLYLFL
jgi:hypothetical protein